MVDAPNASGGRSRSFGGCATCRSRHMKCDERRPACLACIALGVQCGGYEKSIFFDFEILNDAEAVRFRRPLLTEKERKRMSEWLTSRVPPKSALRAISQIDAECEKSLDRRVDLEIRRGPFGAFRFTQCQALTQEPTSPGESNPTTLEVVQLDEYDLALTDELLSEWTIPPELDQGDRLLNLESIDLDMDCWMDPVNAIDTNETPNSLIDVLSAKDLHISPRYSTPTSVLTPIVHSPNFSSFSSLVAQDVILLIKTYSTTVLRLFTPFRHTKTPWHVLFIPHAKNCLASLTLGEQLDDASLGGLHGLLAISALSLAGESQMKAWLDRSKAYTAQANKHISLMLKTAYDVPKPAKYKSILMALVSMIQLSLLCGNREQTEYYLLEAEKLIRLKGLKRMKSRKVRLLHHCYAFERMFYESTSPGETNPHHSDLVRKAVESSGLHGLPRTYNWKDLEEKMTQIKGREEGENDLHLEQPGIFAATLYPEIFGIPEMWMYVVSQIIRLGRAKDASESGNDSGISLTVKEFTSRAKAIERCINKLHTERFRPISAEGSLYENDELEIVLDAMQHALAIYFYRRIYDVNASMLQQEATKVRDCLLRHESIDLSEAYGTARLIWPAFIAASEAEDRVVQASFSAWFEQAASRSGLPIFRETLKNLEQIWHEKRQLNRSDVTWLSLARENVLVR